MYLVNIIILSQPLYGSYLQKFVLLIAIYIGGEDSILARVSIVNHFGNLVYDTFVAATERVTDYRTAVSGVRPQVQIIAVLFNVWSGKPLEATYSLIY